MVVVKIIVYFLLFYSIFYYAALYKAQRKSNKALSRTFKEIYELDSRQLLITQEIANMIIDRTVSSAEIREVSNALSCIEKVKQEILKSDVSAEEAARSCLSEKEAKLVDKINKKIINSAVVRESKKTRYTKS